MKVQDFAEIIYAKAGKPRVLKYFIFAPEILEVYFHKHRFKPARLAKTLNLHYQSMRKLLQSAGFWHYVSKSNGRGSGDNLKRKCLATKDGYKYSSDPESVAIKNGRSRRKLEHIEVAEQILGRPLKACEVTHHIDGNKLNNCPSNLYICTRRQHGLVHKQLESLAMSLVQEGKIQFSDGAYKWAQ